MHDLSGGQSLSGGQLPSGERRKRGLTRAWLPVGVAAASSLAVLVTALEPEPLAAGGGRVADLDADGLAAAQEAVLGTDPALADTDGDGYSDAEELARRSDPLDVTSLPGGPPTQVGMAARGEDGLLRVVVAIYLEDGLVENRAYTMGALAAGRLTPLAPAALAGAQVAQKDGHAPGSRVVVVDAPFSPVPVHVLGELSLFTTVSSPGGGVVEAAGAADLASSEGVLFHLVDHQDDRPLLTLGTGGTGGGAGSVYLPIPSGGDGDIPSSWTVSEICYQATEIVGVSGAIVTYEVVAADCIPDWDAYCATSCASTVGDTFDRLDPTILVGY